MEQEEEPDISKLLAQANAALNSVNAYDFHDADPSTQTNTNLDQDNVDFTAEDMNDPDLLAQLAQFGDSDHDIDNNDGDDGDEKVFEEMKSKALQSLKQKIATTERKSNEFRDANNTQNYKLSTQCVKELKFVLSQINEMDSIEFVTDKEEIETQINTVLDKISKLSAVNNINNNDDEEATEQMLLQRYKEYKFAAKKAKDDGDKMSAINYLKQSKVIAEYVSQTRSGIVIWDSDVPSSLPRRKWDLNATAASNKEDMIQKYRTLCMAAKKEGNIPLAKEYLRKMKALQSNENVEEEKVQQRPRSLSSIQKSEYSKIVKQLKVQMNESKSDASFLTQSSDDKQSQQLLQYAKQSQIELQKVMECEKLKLEPPKYDTFSIKIKTLNVNNDIEENELRVIIGKLSNLCTKGSTDVYLTAKIENILNVETPTKKVKFSADFNITKRCKIERNKKLTRQIKFGKFNVCLYQNKLFGDVLLGSAVLKLKALLETSSIKEIITIKSEEERKKIADLNVEIKLRKPVLTEGYTMITKQLIKITKYPEKPPPPPQRAPKQPQRVPKQKPQQMVKQIPKVKAAPKQSNLPNGLSQEMVDNPLDVVYIESFECISHEIELCNQEILQKGGRNCQDINDRLQGLNTNKSILEVQVNNGLITLEQYTAKIKKAMITDLSLAKYLKTQNRKMEAVKVLQRYKLMKKEIQGT